MESTPTSPTPLPGWVRALAALTAVAALPVMLLGAQVTSMDVGMVDPVPIRAPWDSVKLLFQDLGLGFLVEHGHRLAGWTLGGFALALAISLVLVERRPVARWMGLLVAALIAIQGSLGIFRVGLHAIFGRDMALIHGLFAQIVFASIFALVWFVRLPAGDPGTASTPRLRRIGTIVTALFVLQIVLGAFVRHRPTPLFGRLHLLGAFVVFGMTFALIYNARQHPGFRAAANWLMAFMTIQIVLGVEAWMAWTKRAYGLTDVGSESLAVHLTRTLHYVFGSILFSAVVVTTLKARLAQPLQREVAAA